MDFAIEGNSYLYKLRDKLGIPRAVIQLHPDRIQTYPYNLEQIDHYIYNAGSSLVNIPKEDIVHFRSPSQNNYIKGTPIISRIESLREVEELQLAYRKKFYQSGGFLGATFTTEQKMSTASFDNAYKMLQDKYGGSDNAFQVALFEQGLKPIPTAYSIRDMQMKDERQLNRDEILAAFKVNKLLLGQSELIQRGNADTVLYVFFSTVIDPLMDYFDEVLTNQLLTQDFSINGSTPYYIRHDNMAQRDIEQDLKYYDNGLKNGWLLPSQVQAEEGYEINLELDEIWKARQLKGSLN